MPWGDGTGPMGKGRLSGRKAGFCAGFQVPGLANPGFGRLTGFWRKVQLKPLSYLAAGLLPGCGYLIYRWRCRNRTGK